MHAAGSSRRPGQDLDRESLETVRSVLASKLRYVFNQPESAVAEIADEMVDQAYIEYAEKPRAEREQVRSLVGLLITTGVRRAIDKARREGREVHGEKAEALIENTEDEAASTEALAVRDIEAAALHEAVEMMLTREQRQVLALYYWEGLSTRKAAAIMGLSHVTFCRRRDAAIERLRECFGIEPRRAGTVPTSLARVRASRRRRERGFFPAG